MRTYLLVKETSKEEFINKCNDHLACGDMPLGGVSTVAIKTSNSMSPKIQYTQAFLREDNR